MKKITLESKYYPKEILNSIAAQNQPYPSSSYYPYPIPTNTFRLNPLVLPSLKTMDIDDLQDVFGKGFQDMNQRKIGEKISNEKMFRENEEIKEIKNAIEYAKLNQARAKQIQQNQYRRIQNLIKDTQEDEEEVTETVIADAEDEELMEDALSEFQDSPRAESGAGWLCDVLHQVRSP